MSEFCHYCIPETRTILDAVGGFMTDKEITSVINGVLALGDVLKCGESKLNCLPLQRLQFQLLRNGNNVKKG